MLYHYTKIIRVYLERYVLKPIIASVIMGLITFVLRERFIIATLSALISYCLVFWAIKGFNRSDLQSLKNYLNAKE
jgi:thiamine transporter ThiT